MIKRAVSYFTEGMPSRGEFPAGLRGWYPYVVHIFHANPPGLVRLMMLQPLAALITGLACILLLRRGFEYVPVIAVCVLAAFIYITIRLYILREKTTTMAARISDLAVLYVINDMLFFIVPFYFESTTFPSRNMLFTAVLGALMVTANWYIVYERWVLRSPLTGSLFYALTFFCVLNFIFPVIFGMRNIRSLAISLAFAGISAVLFMYPSLPAMESRKNRLKFYCGIILTLAVLWVGRSFIPPSPLRMTMAAACTGIDAYRPVMPFSEIKAGEVRDVYFYSSVFAPRGLSEKIEHIWYYEGRRLFTVRLSEIRGGRREGFGTWSRHAVLEGPGRYTVEVWTAGGQLLGNKSFIIRPELQ